jgi:hypothetical protein
MLHLQSFTLPGSETRVGASHRGTSSHYQVAPYAHLQSYEQLQGQLRCHCPRRVAPVARRLLHHFGMAALVQAEVHRVIRILPELGNVRLE